ncbi:MAG: bifunctional oligoribonuclease/PAP phosphatase NrnA [Candidatus Moraniibacteriota bacterium]
MSHFISEFRNLKYVIRKSEKILLFAHNRPDPDSVGANLALREMILACGKSVDIACYNEYPSTLTPIIGVQPAFLHPDSVNIKQYDTVIAADSVDRGFHLFRDRISEDQIVVIIDHHPDITVRADIKILDTTSSSASQLVYDFLVATKEPITPQIATCLLMGILFDTGGFQHAIVSPEVMSVAADLVKKGAPLTKIAHTLFSNNDVAALRLWGKAFEKAHFNEETGMLVTAITREDIAECEASVEDIYQVAFILSGVPEAKFVLVLSEQGGGMVRGSLRSTKQQGVDVSALAQQFGGGGHRLASGFELVGKIVETDFGWQIA